jgi:hypothetical protein
MGLQKELLIRLRARGEYEHLHKLLKRVWPRLALGQLITFCAAVGADLLRERELKAKPRLDLSGTLADDVAAVGALKAKALFQDAYDAIYGDLPGPGLSVFIVYCADQGSDVVRDKYLLASARQKKITGKKAAGV